MQAPRPVPERHGATPAPGTARGRSPSLSAWRASGRPACGGRRPRSGLACVAVLLAACAGCGDPGARVRLSKDNDRLRVDVERLKRDVRDRDATIERLERQVHHLADWGPNRPVDLFAPVRIDILSRSGGFDFDGRPGDDGVVAYIRPLDRDGHAVKTPGTIRVQLLDNSDLNAPRVLGLYVFDDPNELRRMWYSAFGTNHFTAKCPFPPGKAEPRGSDIAVTVEFVDYITGATLTATKVVSISRRTD